MNIYILIIVLYLSLRVLVSSLTQQVVELLFSTKEKTKFYWIVYRDLVLVDNSSSLISDFSSGD